VSLVTLYFLTLSLFKPCSHSGLLPAFGMQAYCHLYAVEFIFPLLQMSCGTGHNSSTYFMQISAQMSLLKDMNLQGKNCPHRGSIFYSRYPQYCFVLLQSPSLLLPDGGSLVCKCICFPHPLRILLLGFNTVPSKGLPCDNY
jgi:hypothetical protein